MLKITRYCINLLKLMYYKKTHGTERGGATPGCEGKIKYAM